MRISVCDDIFLSEIISGDQPAYVEHFKERQIYEQTLAIPYPYTEANADQWIHHVAEETRKQGRSINWAIRQADGRLIGGIGFHALEVGKSHRAELGYWLARPFWGLGIMTNAVKKCTEIGFTELGLVRITAGVFHFNPGSARVLEKAGFRFEGRLHKYYKKDGRIFDGLLYAKTPDDATDEALILRSHHSQVSIPKGSEDQARGFYCGVLGLRETAKPEILRGRGGFWIQLDNVQIHFGAEDGVARSATKSHVAYKVVGLEKLRERLISRGIQVLDGIPIPGYQRFEFRDPFGNRVEFLERA